ncbi:MAG TPA: ROK family protein [Blastocatellia bacterium]|nr:ROK family protein [Blastocatellia bacterium]
MTTAQKTTGEKPAEQTQPGPETRILAIDIGGTGLKAAILDSEGNMLTERHRIDTPKLSKPDDLVEAIATLVVPLGGFDCVSVGFPGVVRKGKIITAPNLGTEEMRGFDLAAALQELLGKPVRVINDADMQGFGAIEGKGIEMVITLGTGFGSSLFMDGELAPHLEIAHLPFRKGKTYEQQTGDKARKKLSKKDWNKRVKLAIDTLRTLTHFDKLYIGGGNSDKIKFKLDPDVQIISNECGVKGGAWLWRDRSAN